MRLGPIAMSAICKLLAPSFIAHVSATQFGEEQDNSMLESSHNTDGVRCSRCKMESLVLKAEDIICTTDNVMDAKLMECCHCILTPNHAELLMNAEDHIVDNGNQYAVTRFINIGSLPLQEGGTIMGKYAAARPVMVLVRIFHRIVAAWESNLVGGGITLISYDCFIASLMDIIWNRRHEMAKYIMESSNIDNEMLQIYLMTGKFPAKMISNLYTCIVADMCEQSKNNHSFVKTVAASAAKWLNKIDRVDSRHDFFINLFRTLIEHEYPYSPDIIQDVPIKLDARCIERLTEIYKKHKPVLSESGASVFKDILQSAKQNRPWYYK